MYVCILGEGEEREEEEREEEGREEEEMNDNVDAGDDK